ncbi:MAG: DUF2235 domain-containing protein [Halobacteriota archaeon]
MAKNIIICSDGTGNTFSKHVSSITRLVKSVELGNPLKQLVFYDQGLGTNPKLVKEIKAYKNEHGKNRAALEILPPPQIRLLRPFTHVLGLGFGYGLKNNVKEMYQALAKHYDPEKDRIFLFGFSRGAFTVRVLAGLIYRCGLPSRDVANNEGKFEKCFSEVYNFYKPHTNNEENKKELRKFVDTQVRVCRIDFLGIWDTVKSYGGILPQSLPHLRHNPIIKKVCHALALDEHRAWFVHTTWGWLDSDGKNLKFIEPDGPDDRYKEQEIKEVWFRGFHSDVGGGDEEIDTAEISLRWILREASGLPNASGLVLNQCGKNIVSKKDADVRLCVHESRTRKWKLSEYMPRMELDNEHRDESKGESSYGGPTKYWNYGPTGKREVENFRRNEYICLHSSLGNSLRLEKVFDETATFIPKSGWQLADKEK